MDQFYTKPEVAKQCVDYLDSKIPISQFTRIIEPSAGRGNFLEHLPSTTEAYDIDPQHPRVVKQDWLAFEPPILNGDKDGCLIIGNPPFGRASGLAVEFIKHALKFGHTVAFILPLSWSKETMTKRLKKERQQHGLGYCALPLPANSFYTPDGKDYHLGAGALFVVVSSHIADQWPQKLPTSHTDFEIETIYVTQADRANKLKCPDGIAVYASRRRGPRRIVRAGDEFEWGGGWHIIRSSNDKVLDALFKIDWYQVSLNSAVSMTSSAGTKHEITNLSKQNIVAAYNNATELKGWPEKLPKEHPDFTITTIQITEDTRHDEVPADQIAIYGDRRRGPRKVLIAHNHYVTKGKWYLIAGSKAALDRLAAIDWYQVSLVNTLAVDHSAGTKHKNTHLYKQDIVRAYDNI